MLVTLYLSSVLPLFFVCTCVLVLSSAERGQQWSPHKFQEVAAISNPRGIHTLHRVNLGTPPHQDSKPVSAFPRSGLSLETLPLAKCKCIRNECVQSVYLGLQRFEYGTLGMALLARPCQEDQSWLIHWRRPDSKTEVNCFSRTASPQQPRYP